MFNVIGDSIWKFNMKAKIICSDNNNANINLGKL